MLDIIEFCKKNKLPIIDLSKSAGEWHKLEEDDFKGSFIYKSVKIKDKELIVVTVYNFKSGESLTERFGASELTKAETSQVNKVIKELEEEARKEKVRKHEQCKKYAQEQFQTFISADISANPYTNRKVAKISEGFKYSIRNRISLLGETDLIAPFYDFEGVLWNYQAINEKGEKLILIGGKYQGLFIPILPTGGTIGGLGGYSKVYIVEGFATGLSIFFALDQKFPVLCAISSTNIYNVCSELRSRYERTPYIICADNDAWKQHVENTGEVTAKQTLSRVDGGAYVLPDFSGCSAEQLASRPTDFNDLHSLRGITEVRRQLGQAVLNRPRVIYPLGYNKKNYYFTTSKVPQIQAVTEFTETDLLKLAPKSFWDAKYADDKGKLDLSAIKSELIDQCQNVGIFEFSRLRGRGIYKDDSKYVLHKGDKIVDLKTWAESDLADVKSRYYYDPRSPIVYQGTKYVEPLMKDIKNALSEFAWADQYEAELCMGWLLSAPLAGALSWRSHIAITAEAASGKTTLLQAISSMLSVWNPLKLEGATEAAIRQTLGTDAIPVILDEQDTNSLDQKAFHKIMSLFRLASSEGEVRRGTVSGASLKFNACFSGLIAGINLPKMNHADTTRFCVIELDPTKKKGSWVDMQKNISVLFEKQTSEMLFTWLIENVEKLVEYIAQVYPFIEIVTDARTAQQYSNLVGASGFALGLTVEESISKFSEYLKYKGGINGEEKDSDQCLDYLFDLTVSTDSDRRTQSLGKVLESSNEPTEVLAQFNMKIVDNKLFLPNAHPLLAKYFGGTPWLNWNKTLKRVKGTEQRVLWMNGKSVRGLVIPVKLGEARF